MATEVFIPVYNKPFTNVIGISDILQKVKTSGRLEVINSLKKTIEEASKNNLTKEEIEQANMLLEVINNSPVKSNPQAEYEQLTLLFRELDAKGLLVPGAYYKEKNPDPQPNKTMQIVLWSALALGVIVLMYFKFKK